jgi:hypothetical protein
MIKINNNMENWNVLRPLLREKFGRDFWFYNDGYKSYRRIKVMGLEDRIEEIKEMGVDVKKYMWGRRETLVIKCVK